MTPKISMRSFPSARRLSLMRQRLNFNGSALYWEQRYLHGQTSGCGSYGCPAHVKAEFLNTFVKEKAVHSVTEFGCGDGNQLSLAVYPRYVGLDVSRSAITLCKSQFADDSTKSFFLYDGDCFVDHANLFAAELAISLDVIYHLVEDPVFEAYMKHLFAAGTRYIVIYSTNTPIPGTAPHVQHRRFSSWVNKNCPEWQLAQQTRGVRSEASQADFFVYQRIRDEDIRSLL